MTLPDGWKQGRLGKLCSIEIGGTPSRGVAAYWDFAHDTSNVWISIRDMRQRLITGSAEQISDLGVKKSNVKLQQPGTVLLSFKLSIGRVALATVPLFTNEAIAGLSPTGLTRDFLFHGLQGWDLLQGVDQAIKGATLNKQKLKKILFEYPESEREQAKIAEVLSTVDRAIEQTEALIAKQQRIKTGLMQDLLTRGIDEYGNLRSEQTHKFKDSPLGRIPVEWEVITLGAMLKRARGYLQTGPFGSQLHAHEYVHEGTPVIMPQDILNGQISTSVIARIPERRANELHRHRLLPNDIVFSRRGDLSRAAGIGERETGWICGTGCFLLRVSPNAIDSTWLANVYRHHHVQRQVETNAVGSTMPSLNNAVMENLILAFPKADEQQEIMRRCDAAADSIASTVDQLAKMRALKRGLMQDLLTGNRRVTPLLEQREGGTT